MLEEDREKEKMEALVEYNLSLTELKKSKMKFLIKILVIVVCFCLIGVLIRVFHGKIYYSHSLFNYNKSIEYSLYLNEERISVGFEDVEETPIIPGLFYFRRLNMGSWYNPEKLNDEIYFEGDKNILTIKSNECYIRTNKIRVNCDSSNDKLIRKEVNVKIERLFIRKNGKKEHIMYDDKFISDISSFVEEKGYYYIEIYAEYDNVKTKLYFFPRRL